MKTYENLKKLILIGNKSENEIKDMMDVFLMNNRITSEQYTELSGLLTE